MKSKPMFATPKASADRQALVNKSEATLAGYTVALAFPAREERQIAGEGYVWGVGGRGLQEERLFKACPFCGNEEVQDDSLFVGIHAVCCDQCGAHGPLEMTEANARSHWNERPKAVLKIVPG